MSLPSFFCPTIAQIKDARDDYQGFCRNCGATRDNVEPNAEFYQCDECGKHSVYGAEEFAINGWVK